MLSLGLLEQAICLMAMKQLLEAEDAAMTKLRQTQRGGVPSPAPRARRR